MARIDCVEVKGCRDRVDRDTMIVDDIAWVSILRMGFTLASARVGLRRGLANGPISSNSLRVGGRCCGGSLGEKQGVEALKNVEKGGVEHLKKRIGAGSGSDEKRPDLRGHGT